MGVKADGVGLRHVERTIGAETQPIRPMRIDQEIEFRPAELQSVEPDLPEIGKDSWSWIRAKRQNRRKRSQR